MCQKLPHFRVYPGPLRHCPSPPATWVWMKEVSPDAQPARTDLTKPRASPSLYEVLQSILLIPPATTLLTSPPSPGLLRLCLHLFDTALPLKTMPQGKCLAWSWASLTSLQTGPTHCVPESNLVLLVFVHTLGSGLLIPHFWHPCPISSTRKMNEQLKVETDTVVIEN